jgi:hypothetical protein
VAKIKTNCPHCGAENRYDPAAAGLHVSCSECGARFQLDYARPQRSCLGSCLTVLLTIALLGAAAGGLAVYFFGWPPQGLPIDLPFTKVAEIPAEQPVPAPAPTEPSPQPPETEASPAAESGPESEPAPAPEPVAESDPPETAAPPQIESEADPASARRNFELREWVDSSGSFRVTARLVQFAAGKVRLEKENGEVIEVPLERLSENDRNYITEMLKR